jgi:hypothetical protein
MWSLCAGNNVVIVGVQVIVILTIDIGRSYSSVKME